MLFYRSGSSLVGSILSAKSTSTYLFEPYHWKHFNHKNGSKLDLHFVKVEEKFISDFTNGLFDCKKVSNFIFLKGFCYLCCFHPILVTWFLVIFGNEVTKIFRNSLFIFHFILPVLPVLPCKQKTSYRK